MPAYAAIRPKSSPGTSGQRFEVMFWPYPDAVYTFTYSYIILPGTITTTQYPLGGMAHAETIMASCLDIAHAYVRSSDDTRARQRIDFMSRLAASVNLDRSAMTPPTLGYNGDASTHGWTEDRAGVGLNVRVRYQGVLY
jgi:hypothetical protein